MDQFLFDNTNGNSAPFAPGGQFNLADFIDLDAIAASMEDGRSLILQWPIIIDSVSL
jgi:hypothetical protein